MDIEKKLSSSLADVISYEKKDSRSKTKGKIGLNKNGKKGKRGITFYQGQENKKNQFNLWKLNNKKQSVQQSRASENEETMPKKNETRVMHQETAQRVKRLKKDNTNKLFLSTITNVEKKKIQRSPRNVIQNKRFLKNFKTFSNPTFRMNALDYTTPFILPSGSKPGFFENEWRQMNQHLNFWSESERVRNPIMFSHSPTWRSFNDFVSLPKPFRSRHSLSNVNASGFNSLSFAPMTMDPKQQVIPPMLPISLNHLKRKNQFYTSLNPSLPFLTPSRTIKTRKQMSGRFFF